MRRYIFCGLTVLANSNAYSDAEIAAQQLTPPDVLITKNIENFHRDTCIKRDDEGRFLGWVDNQHCFLSTRATQTAQWLDGLFGQYHHDDELVKNRIRVINDFSWLESSGLSANMSIRASLKLPNAKRRLHLVISDDEDTLNPQRKIVLKDSEAYKTSAAIRWIPNIASRVRYSFDIGAHATDIFARFRAQRAWRVSDESLLNFRQSVRYGLKTEVKAVSELETERLLTDKTVLRLGTALQYWQNEPQPVGLRWSQSSSILHFISRNRSIAYGFTIDGVQQPHWQVANDRLFFLYRQSIWRSWLYYELEPQLVRDWTTDKDVKSLFVFRLEANLGN